MHGLSGNSPPPHCLFSDILIQRGVAVSPLVCRFCLQITLPLENDAVNKLKFGNLIHILVLKPEVTFGHVQRPKPLPETMTVVLALIMLEGSLFLFGPA